MCCKGVEKGGSQLTLSQRKVTEALGSQLQGERRQAGCSSDEHGGCSDHLTLRSRSPARGAESLSQLFNQENSLPRVQIANLNNLQNYINPWILIQ